VSPEPAANIKRESEIDALVNKTITMNFIFTIILLLTTSIFCIGPGASDSLLVRFIFPGQKIRDSANLTLLVVYKNVSEKDVQIYQYLDEGNPGDRFHNVYVKMQLLVNQKYIDYTMRYYPVLMGKLMGVT
jgi:hypothetical protein